MPKIYVVGFDGSEEAQRAVDFAAEQAASAGAEIIVAHVLEWSPYSFLTQEELAERHKRREEELTRAETAILAPLRKGLTGKGVAFKTVVKYGRTTETLIDIAKEAGAQQLFLGRTGQTGLSARMFGSVAGSLAQVSPIPCTIVP